MANDMGDAAGCVKEWGGADFYSVLFVKCVYLTLTGLLPPTASKLPSCNTRKSFAWTGSGEKVAFCHLSPLLHSRIIQCDCHLVPFFHPCPFISMPSVPYFPVSYIKVPPVPSFSTLNLVYVDATCPLLSTPAV